MSFATLVGNERNKEVLRRLLARGRLSATLVFAGPEGVGKRQFALTLAKAANCRRAAEMEADSCDECAVCQRVDAGTYGDVMLVAREKSVIRVEQAREMSAEVYFRPREGRQRFFIIDEADRLHEGAANALLKTLEEPPATSTIILLTARPDALLTTVRSRAQRLNFAPLSTPEMEQYLAANYRRPAADTALLARVTGGRIGQATAIDVSEYRRERRTLLELLDLLAAGEDRYRLLKAAEFLGKQDRDGFERLLNFLIALLRDLFLLAAGAGREAVVNIDVADWLEALAARVGTRRLSAWAARLDELRANLRVNINRQVATEAALLGLAEDA